MGLTWGELGDYLINSAADQRIPIVGQFELTARCNLKCKMCYVCLPNNERIALKRERTTKEWLQLARDARDEGMLYLLLTGGEVFVREDFMTLYEEMSMMGFHIQVNTNGTMVTPNIAKKLGLIPPSKVGVTIYGSSSETYAKVCGNGDGYERTLKGIDLLLNEGINVEIKTTIIPDNIRDYRDIVITAFHCPKTDGTFCPVFTGITAG